MARRFAQWSASNYFFKRPGPGPVYNGPVKALILDWSGTTADKYVLAPAVVFVDVFQRAGVPISMQEARQPMGLRKDLHIKAITEMEEVRERWKKAKGSYPTQSDVDKMFADFVPLQLECLRKYTSLLPGVAEVIARFQKEGIKVGSTTGFLSSMVDVLLDDAKKQGYVPDASVAGDHVEHGARPRPFMVYKNLDMLDVFPIQSVVKVDDTVSGVGEALNAGCWGVGVARYSNYMDIDSFEQEEALSKDEVEKRLVASRKKLEDCGAHYVIDSLTDLPRVMDDVSERLKKGEKP